jgi:hypothetical protein
MKVILFYFLDTLRYVMVTAPGYLLFFRPRRNNPRTIARRDLRRVAPSCVTSGQKKGSPSSAIIVDY